MGCGEEGCKDPIFQYGGYKASSSYMGRVARRTPEGLLSYTVARTSRRKVPAAITPVTVEPDKILYETLASFDGKLFRVARCVLLDATKASYLIAHECEGDVSQGEIELDLVNNKVEIAKGNPHFPVGDSFDFMSSIVLDLRRSNSNARINPSRMASRRRPTKRTAMAKR